MPIREPLLANRKVDGEDVVVVPDAQSGPNEVGVCPSVRASCSRDDGFATPQEIPLTQNHPNKCTLNTLFFLILHYFPCLNGSHVSGLNAGDNPDNDGCAPVRPSTNMDPGFIASITAWMLTLWMMRSLMAQQGPFILMMTAPFQI